MDGSVVLVVDDDKALAEVVTAYLTRAGLRGVQAATGRDALRRFDESQPDLVLLDLMLPDLDGLEVCRRLRQHSDVPVIMLTALGEEVDRVLGLEVGADDYVTKPFSPRELVLRVQSVLRRTERRTGSRNDTGVDAAGATVKDGGLVVDFAARAATLDGKSLSLTSREFDLLSFFLSHPRIAFSREDLMQQVWGWTVGDHSTVTVHVRRLREKIERDPTNPERLVTVWGVGYRWDPAP
ncbi:MAG TPA: response regulator transcription factor [Actinomycetes bacterium]|nr:response regulator transcription factor [Actinomycetes bacterium]